MASLDPRATSAGPDRHVAQDAGFALLHLPLFGSPDGWGIAWFTLPRALGPAAVTAVAGVRG